MTASNSRPAAAADPALDDLVERATRLCEALAGVLEREQSALETRDLASLAAATRLKRQLVAELDAIALRQSDCLEARRAGTSRSDGDHRPRGETAPHRSKERWDRLEDVARRCQRQNRTIGQIIEVQRRHTERFLAILHGSPESGSGMIYGPRGEQRVLARTRYVATA